MCNVQELSYLDYAISYNKIVNKRTQSCCYFELRYVISYKNCQFN